MRLRLSVLTIIISLMLTVVTMVPLAYGQILPVAVPSANQVDGNYSATVAHVVMPGESVWQIARTYKVEIKKILTANRLKNPDQIFAGQLLVIPGKTREQTSRGVQAVLAPAQKEWIWPILGVLTSDYGLRKDGFHHGLDIAADPGEPIRAAMDGRVSFVGWLNSIYGFVVMIDHSNGLQSLYAHTSQNLVKVKQVVEAGTPVALIGDTGRATGPHLHFEIRRQGYTIDPALFLKPGSDL
ncbi:MAG: M23 family metallopeptidase [Bacillota bacterium]